jgi:hypothetical protein
MLYRSASDYSYGHIPPNRLPRKSELEEIGWGKLLGPRNWRSMIRLCFFCKYNTTTSLRVGVGGDTK